MGCEGGFAGWSGGEKLARLPRIMIRSLLFALAALTAVAAAAAPPPMPAPGPEPRARPALVLTCAADGVNCIASTSYLVDVCRVIEAEAVGNALDPNFFARLVWRESLFDASAVSPAGAQGIAQFMPETARLRGLADPFNPVEALRASARYLSDLRARFGNIGLAAAAYNGGEARAQKFVAAEGGLAAETRAYVSAITGHSAEAWRDSPPAAVDLALSREGAFQTACVAHAERRRWREYPDTPPLRPWGVILASNRDRDGAERQMSRLRNRYAAVLDGEQIAYSHARGPGMPRRRHMAQIGRETRADAEAFCARLRAAGGACMVLRN